MNINGVKVLKISKKILKSNKMTQLYLLILIIIVILSNSCGNKELEDEEFYLNYWEIYKYKHTEDEMIEMKKDNNELYTTDRYIIDTLFVRNNELISNCSDPVIRFINKENYNFIELNKIKKILKIDSLELLDSIIFENKVYYIPIFAFFSEIEFRNKTYIKKTYNSIFELNNNSKEYIVYETIDEFGVLRAYTDYNKNARAGYYNDRLFYRLTKKVLHKDNKNSVVFDLSDMKLKY